MEFNEKLRQLRIGKNLTQEQLAFIATAKQDKIKIVVNPLKTRPKIYRGKEGLR